MVVYPLVSGCGDRLEDCAGQKSATAIIVINSVDHIATHGSDDDPCLTHQGAFAMMAAKAMRISKKQYKLMYV